MHVIFFNFKKIEKKPLKKSIASFGLFLTITFSNVIEPHYYGFSPSSTPSLIFVHPRYGMQRHENGLPKNGIIETNSRKEQDALVIAIKSMEHGCFNLEGFSDLEKERPEKLSYKGTQIKALCSIRGNSIPDPVKATIFEFIGTTIPKKGTYIEQGTYIEHRGYYVPVSLPKDNFTWIDGFRVYSPNKTKFKLINDPIVINDIKDYDKLDKLIGSILKPKFISHGQILPRFRLQIANS